MNSDTLEFLTSSLHPKETLDIKNIKIQLSNIYSDLTMSPEYVNFSIVISNNSNESITQIKQNKKIIFDNMFIAGGCFTSLLHNNIPRDIDIFVPFNINTISPSNITKVIGAYKQVYTGKIVYNMNTRAYNFQYIFDPYTVDHPTEVARKLILDEFDVIHAKSSYYGHGDILYTTPMIYRCAKYKILIPAKSTIRQSRKEKFINMGWTQLDSFGNVDKQVIETWRNDII